MEVHRRDLRVRTGWGWAAIGDEGEDEGLLSYQGIDEQNKGRFHVVHNTDSCRRCRHAELELGDKHLLSAYTLVEDTESITGLAAEEDSAYAYTRRVLTSPQYASRWDFGWSIVPISK